MPRSKLIRWSGLAGLLGGLLFAIPGVLFGLGMAWLGYALWSENREMAARARPVL